jgi:hypothetical protein
MFEAGTANGESLPSASLQTFIAFYNHVAPSKSHAKCFCQALLPSINITQIALSHSEELSFTLQHAFQSSQHVQFQQTAESTLVIPIPDNLHPRRVVIDIIINHLHHSVVLQLLPANGQHGGARTVHIRETTISSFSARSHPTIYKNFTMLTSRS